jgi:hypothetical protein
MLLSIILTCNLSKNSIVFLILISDFSEVEIPHDQDIKNKNINLKKKNKT